MNRIIFNSRGLNLISIVTIMLLVFLAEPGLAGSNLIEQSAFQTSNISSSVLMDVTQAGERLVAVGERGMITYSDDHGVTWIQAVVPVRETLTAVTFPSPTDGWAVGHGTIVLHSTDSGESWDKVMDGSKINNLMVNSMQTIVTQKRQKVAQASEHEKAELQLALEDAKDNLNGLLETKREGSTMPLLDVYFFTEQVGIIVGAFGIILRTDDGGQNWAPLLDQIDNPFGYHFYAFAKTSKALFLFGEAGLMFRSLDNGRSWKALETVYEGSFFGAVGNPTGDCVAAFGLRGTLVSSCDAGDSWSSQEVGPGVALNVGIISPVNQYVLAGLAGSIFTSKKTLDNFLEIPTGFPGCMSMVDAGDEHLVLVGLAGIHRVALPHTLN